MMTKNERLRYLVLEYFREGAKSTNFHRHESFDEYPQMDVQKMLHSLTLAGLLERIDTSTTNGAAYGLTANGFRDLNELEDRLEKQTA